MSKTTIQNMERQFVSLIELEKFKLSKDQISIEHFAFESIKNLPF